MIKMITKRINTVIRTTLGNANGYRLPLQFFCQLYYYCISVVRMVFKSSTMLTIRNVSLILFVSILAALTVDSNIIPIPPPDPFCKLWILLHGPIILANCFCYPYQPGCEYGFECKIFPDNIFKNVTLGRCCFTEYCIEFGGCECSYYGEK